MKKGFLALTILLALGTGCTRTTKVVIEVPSTTTTTAPKFNAVQERLEADTTDSTFAPITARIEDEPTSTTLPRFNAVKDHIE